MNDQYSNQSLFTLRINENTRISLKGTAIVAGVAAIISLAGSILSFIKIFIDRNRPTVEYRYEGFRQTRVETTSSIFGGVIMLGIAILLFYFLNRFSSQTKQGLNLNNQQMVNNGLGGLSGYFVTIGVLLIIALIFFLFALLVSI